MLTSLYHEGGFQLKKFILNPITNMEKDQLWQLRIALGSCTTNDPDKRENALFPTARVVAQNLLSDMKKQCGAYQAQYLYLSKEPANELLLVCMHEDQQISKKFPIGPFLDNGASEVRHSIFMMCMSEALGRWPMLITSESENTTKGAPKEYPFFSWDLR